MNPQWHKGTIELVNGYALMDADHHPVASADGVAFALEGGFVHVRLPGVPHTQLVSAPAVRLITCES